MLNAMRPRRRSGSSLLLLLLLLSSIFSHPFFASLNFARALLTPSLAHIFDFGREFSLLTPIFSRVNCFFNVFTYEFQAPGKRITLNYTIIKNKCYAEPRKKHTHTHSDYVAEKIKCHVGKRVEKKIYCRYYYKTLRSVGYQQSNAGFSKYINTTPPDKRENFKTT